MLHASGGRRAPAAVPRGEYSRLLAEYIANQAKARADAIWQIEISLWTSLLWLFVRLL